jgi:serine protease inhibitor
MAYAGAVGTTATEMATALHFTLAAARLHPAFDWLDLQLASRASAATANQGQPFALSVANSLWADKTESIEMPFLDILATNYGAGVRLVDFIGQPDPSRVAINGWVSDQTNMKIADLLPLNSITTDTRFVIVNAIYFKANWASEFQTFATAPAAFTKFDGSTEQVPTMNQTTTYPYAAGAGWQAVELPYDGNQVAMDVVSSTRAWTRRSSRPSSARCSRRAWRSRSRSSRSQARRSA